MPQGDEDWLVQPTGKLLASDLLQPGELDKLIPAKPAVVLLRDADGNPVQLLSTSDVRAALRKRLLTDSDAPAPAKAANLSQVTKDVLSWLVGGTFEADWVYLQLVRQIYPDSYRGLISHRQAFFVQADVSQEHPKLTKVVLGDGALLNGHSVQLFGPCRDKHAAGRLIEQMEAAFDLCRYHHVLVQSPQGKACAYKGMGRCPAPCDGSISLTAYRQQFSYALDVLSDPAEEIAHAHARMQEAATVMAFEQAAKVQAYIEELTKLTDTANRHVKPLEAFDYLLVTPTGYAGKVKLFRVCRTGLRHLGTWKVAASNAVAKAKKTSSKITQNDSGDLGKQNGLERRLAEHDSTQPADHVHNMEHDVCPASDLPDVTDFPSFMAIWRANPAEKDPALVAQELALVSDHLYKPRSTTGVLHAADLSAQAIKKIVGLVLRKPPDTW